MIRHVKHVARLTAAWLLIAVGIVLGPLPIVPGWPLVLLGAMMLGFNHERMLAVVDWCEARFPWLRRLTGALRRGLTRRQPSKEPV